MFLVRYCYYRSRIYTRTYVNPKRLSLTYELHMNQRQWQEVEAIVRKEQERALQHLNNARYDELKPILDELYKLAHE